jgi:hypothetical protein
MLAVANTGSILRSRTCLMGRGLRRFAQAALLGAVALLAAPALAQQVTPVPSSALTVENWMSSGSVTVQSPTSALVGQSTAGFRWDVSFFVDSSNNPDVYNAIKAAANNGGSLDYTIRFDPSLIVVPGAQPTFIGVNTFYQTDDAVSNFIQNYNIPILGSADFPVTTEQSLPVSIPIGAWTTPTVPANGTGTAWFEPNGGWYKVGFGLNFDNASSVGFYLDSIQVTAVPEPGSFALIAAGAGLMAGVANRRRRV